MLVISVTACERKPQESAAAPSGSQSTPEVPRSVDNSEKDEKTLVSDFTAFATKFGKHVIEGYPNERVTIEGMDVERTQSLMQPIRGKVVARIAAKDTAKGVDWRLTYRFDRKDNKWSPATTEVEVVRDDRGLSKDLVGTMRQTAQRMAEAFTIMAYKD